MMEQYTVVDYKYPPKNRCERLVVKYIKELLDSPVDMTIEQVRHMILSYIARIPASWGMVTLSELQANISIVGKPWICQREFCVHTTGRKAVSALIYETVMKDAKNNYLPVID